MSIRGQFYLPLLNADLADTPEITLGENVSIAQIPDDLQTFLCDDEQVVAGYESAREKVSCGVKLILDDSNKSWASLFEPETTVSVLQSVIVTARLLTQIPLDYPFWVGREGSNSGRGRTNTRTYRTGLAYTHQPLDQPLLEDAMAVLAQRTPWLIQNVSARLDKLDVKHKVIRALELAAGMFQMKHASIRVVLAVVILECLFSTDNIEISHQLAERIAWFLHPTESSQRVETYKVVKDCYDLRSEVVHGNVKTKPKKYLSWLDAVVQSEELVSAVFLRLLSEQTYIDTMNYSSKLLAQEFKHLVLGESSKLA